jgi:hypothetical protein
VCARRTRLVNHPLYHAQALLAKARTPIGTDPFDHRRVFRGGEHGQRTNTQVERTTRGWRMRQKTRDKRRQTHPMEKALELERDARLVEQPVDRPQVRKWPSLFRKKPVLKMAA